MIEPGQPAFFGGGVATCMAYDVAGADDWVKSLVLESDSRVENTP